MSATLSFGKYKNFTIHEVYDKDPSYCRWLRNQKMLIEDPDSDISKFLASKFANGSDDGSYLLNFGKYKGKYLLLMNNIYSGYALLSLLPKRHRSYVLLLMS
ncbi:hypothetical protein JG688_00018315 [Phytophthora aleatoria]|uniref:Exodeoxyribonuclease X-like C-terminal domain-containing protein n=1 Tax=Phytophthora aleatoria TaxID=2496075 RepID=A0A8J5IPM2_9STRA|nr:hypothetical protein JG688_00018315 [Phytophthora aleatoria]